MSGRLLDRLDGHAAVLGDERQKFHEPHGIDDIGEAYGRVRGGRLTAEAFAHLAQPCEQKGDKIGVRRHKSALWIV
jgi:hypothetical protein